jgi:type III secretory pathway lipoprotein EscJ
VHKRSVVVLLALLVLVGGCTRTKTLDAQQLDQKIASDMKDNLDMHGVTVSCPDDVPAEAGRTFGCNARSAEGTAMAIEVTQTDDRGNVTYEVVGAG